MSRTIKSLPYGYHRAPKGHLRAEKAKGFHSTESSILYLAELTKVAVPHIATAAQRAKAFLKVLNYGKTK